MKKISLLLLQLFILFWVFTPGKTYAFGCDTWTKNVNVTPFTVGRDDAVTASLSAATLYCSGASADALRVYSVTLNPKLVNAGFTDTTLSISSVGNYTYPFSSSIYKCVWNTSCVGTGSQTATSTFTPTIKRVAGTWPDLVAMNSGESLLTIKLQQKGYYSSTPSWGTNMVEINYKLTGAIIPPVYTCNINTYDNTVTLPATQVSDIRSQSSGRVGSSTRFNIKLDCDKKTKVSLQFDGTKMSGTGTEDVLVNQNSGNSNIGIQLYRADTGAAIAFGNKYVVTDRSDTTENLAFDAYYYYKGGSVSAGMIKSTSTFVFTYE